MAKVKIVITHEVEYELEEQHYPEDKRTTWTCFPEGLDTSNFVDISTIGDPWGKFLDTETGKTYDCAEYYERAMGSMKDL